MIISAIIPAYNEEKTIKNVLEVVTKVKCIDQIIVISDGSIDNTASISRSMGVDVVELHKNVGKGGAIKSGLDKCNGDIILLLDADLIGLTKEHVEDLIIPVVEDKADMTIGVFSFGRFATDLAQRIAPSLSGQRALKRALINKVKNIDITRYGIEVALTEYAKKENAIIRLIELKNMTHCMKEEKLGFVHGFSSRISMYWDILKCLRYAKVK